MTRIWAALRQHAWLFLLLLVPLLGVVLTSSNQVALVAFALFAFMAGAIFAIVGQAHPLRNGTLWGTLATLIALPVTGLVRNALGNATLAEGETWFSQLIEAPYWLALFTPIIIVVTFAGAAVVYMATPGRGVHAPR